MSRNKNKEFANTLTDMVAGIRVAQTITGGSQLSSYQGMAYTNNYSLLTINRIILTYLYSTNGIFQTAIQVPIQDAIMKGIEIESPEMDNDDIQEVLTFWDENGWWEKILDYWTWVRLYGGGALLINTNQDPKEPLNYKTLKRGPLDLYDIDRWQIDTNAAYFDDYETLFSSGTETEFFYLWGTPIHKSRFVRGRGKRAPSYIRRQLRGWGFSVGERMIRDINLYLKTQDVLYEILDESKVDIYHIEGLANKMLTAGGTDAITRRVQAANELKNYIHALVLDTKETFEQKTMTFSGLAEVMRENRIGVAAALRIPVTKLFGVSSSGFNSGEDDLEQYNQMVESEIRAPLMPSIRELMKISMSYMWGYVPKFSLKWPAMRVLTEMDEAVVKDSEQNRLLQFYDRGLLDSTEMMQSAKKSRLISIETKAEQGLVPNPVPPNGAESIAPVGIPAKNPSANALDNWKAKRAEKRAKLKG